MRTTDVIKVAKINELFPRPTNYAEIKEDVSIRGIQEQVIVNTNNELLCGYTRLDIAEELDFDEIPSRTVEVINLNDMVEYAILNNIRRRQLSDSKFLELALKLEELFGDRQGQRTDYPKVENGNTRDLVADKTIATKAVPKVKVLFKEGELTQKEALALTKVEPDKQVKIIKQIWWGNDCL